MLNKSSFSLVTAGIFTLFFLLLSSSLTAATKVRLTAGGRAKCVIVVPANSLHWAGDDKKLWRWYKYSEVPERERRLLRDSIKDLAYYLEKISGAKVAIITTGKKPQAGVVPIYIGTAAVKAFGKIPDKVKSKYVFRVIVKPDKIGLYGRSKVATTYAIYEFLHRLGCRWYMPSELGECIPHDQDLSIPLLDYQAAPATLWRRMEARAADADFKRRNRLGDDLCNGDALNARHALGGYLTKEQRQAHPEWWLRVKGKPNSRYLRWACPAVAEAMADNIIKKLDKNYEPTISLSPGDYVVPTEDPEERQADPTPRVWEPAANKWSVTDRLVLLANRIAERVGKKYSKVRFGLLAYVNYSMPPRRYKVHPNVVPVIAPIDFNRAHPMTWDGHPNDHWLLNMVRGWGKMARSIGYYAYCMNLAETTAPNPFITKWKTNIPIVLKNNCKYWMPETMAGWETTLPALYFSSRITFDPKENVDDILDEMMKRFYGPAAEPMKRYWYGIDRAWIDSKEYAGSAFSYLRIFTPKVMKAARSNLNEALSKCRKGSIEYQRVQLINESFSLFELFMKMRNDFANGRFEHLNSDLNRWRTRLSELRKRYKKQYCFQNYTLEYVNSQFGKAYENAAAMGRQYTRLGKPILNWKYRQDKEKKAETLGWTKPEFKDDGWKSTHVVRDTWSHLGFHNYMGIMVYRTTINIAKLPKGKKIWLWIGSTDGTAQVFVNGKPVPYVVEKDSRRHKKGDVLKKFSGYCKPAKFAVGKYLKKGKNQLTVICERTWLNELGTGGLMGPVCLYAEK